ncbi:hypothetical protein [Methylophaga lonarensis]|uniref:hypothetical protein n=1 Tax=Methylophaga lonarensis TaxID=999151 RepID=UPI003D2DFB16
MKIWLTLLMVGLLVWQCRPEAEVILGPGVKAAAEPVQQLMQQAQPFDLKGYMVTPLATFSLEAKVLAKKRYRIGRESDLSPYDLALGWGQMSDEAVLEHIEISQSGRWYRWRTQNFPIPRRAIERQSANMHLVPADNAVLQTLKQIQPGQVIALQGKLIRVDAADGWHWKSSLTREDTGHGACELVYVTGLNIVAGH